MSRSVVRTAGASLGSAATERVLATVGTPNLGQNPLVGGVIIEVCLNGIAPGTSTTNVTFKVRKGTVAGAQVGVTYTPNPAAANAAGANGYFKVFDPAPVSGQNYVITATAAAQAGAGTIGEVIVETTAA
jgi:hypothetical protein